MADKNPILEAAKRIPAQVAMGPADLLNLALGLVSGNGLGGVTRKSPSETINQDLLGLPEPELLSAQGGMELAAGFVNPAKAIAAVGKATALSAPALLALMQKASIGTAGKIANKQAGIIGGNKIIEDLGLESVANKVRELTEAGASQNKIARETADILEKKGNPYGTYSMYMGPDGQPRLVISNKDAKLKETPLISHVKGESSLAGIRDKNTQVPLSELLDFPLLYQLSPGAAEAKVGYNFLTDLLHPGTLAYSPKSNTVEVGSRVIAPSRLRNDPEGNFLEGLLHEAQHLIQGEGGMRTGTSSDINQLLGSVLEAETKGSFRDLGSLAQIRANIQRGDPETLKRLYSSNYGEFEARAASEFAPTTFPMTYGKMTW